MSWLHLVPKIPAVIMVMGCVSRESGVLKLVYPGGFVELYKSPITAAEVMKRNPRHCVTRPDVFKFPWIVVKPESVLKPGRVYFIVPYHTLHRLLQSKGSRNKPFSGEEDSYRRLKVTSLMESWTDEEDIYRGHDRMHRKQDSTEISCELTHFHRLVKEGNPIASETKVNIRCDDWHEDFSGSNYLVGRKEQYRNKFCRKQSLIFQSRYQLKTKQDIDDSPKKQYKNHQQNQENRQVHLFLEERPLFSVQCASRNDKAHGLMPRYDGRLELNSPQQITKLKSCLKKKNNVAKSSGFRVRFALDEQDHKKLVLSSTVFQQNETP